MVDVFPYIYPGNNISVGTGWMKKVDKSNNGSTTMTVKLDFDGLLYHYIPLKYVTKVDILNRIHSEPQKNRKCCDNITKKEINKTRYTDNDMHENIEPKIQKMSKIQVLRMILH